MVEPCDLENEFVTALTRGCESNRRIDDPSLGGQDSPDWLRLSALVFMHLGCLTVFWTGWSWAAVTLAFFSMWLARAVAS